MKLASGIWRGINRINKFIQSFQVDVVRCAQSDLKQQVRFFSYRWTFTERSNCKRNFQNFSEGTKCFLPAADFHGNELEFLVQMYTAGRKFSKFPRKINSFVAENFDDCF